MAPLSIVGHFTADLVDLNCSTCHSEKAYTDVNLFITVNRGSFLSSLVVPVRDS